MVGRTKQTRNRSLLLSSIWFYCERRGFILPTVKNHIQTSAWQHCALCKQIFRITTPRAQVVMVANTFRFRCQCNSMYILCSPCDGLFSRLFEHNLYVTRQYCYGFTACGVNTTSVWCTPLCCDLRRAYGVALNTVQLHVVRA